MLLGAGKCPLEVFYDATIADREDGVSTPLPTHANIVVLGFAIGFYVKHIAFQHFYGHWVLIIFNFESFY